MANAKKDQQDAEKAEIETEIDDIEARIRQIENGKRIYFKAGFEGKTTWLIEMTIESGQTISQPLTVAIQSSLLDIRKGDKVLEIGTGSGYQACVLEEMGAKVFTLERHQQLYRETSLKLKKMGYTGIRTYLKDGFEGLPRHAPYDKIIVTCAAPEIPQTLLDQLASPGLLVVPVDAGDNQKMKLIRKDSEGRLTMDDHGDFRFVPFLSGISRK